MMNSVTGKCTEWRDLVDGSALIASVPVPPRSADRFVGVAPGEGAELGVAYGESTAEDVSRACAAAGSAADALADAEDGIRADLLDDIAARLQSQRDALVEVAECETALGTSRLQGEIDRTCGQLRSLATFVRRGRHRDVVISTADPTRGIPDIRRWSLPLGPVVVFAASNFPFAFSVAGGDTASALAVGCPVVVKAHPGHPSTSELVGRAVAEAVVDAGLPHGSFSMLHGRQPELTRWLAENPQVAAVAFTGSNFVGRLLHDIASSRPHPIPVYAEMGSTNPVFISGTAIEARGSAIAAGLADSITLGAGQFCTKPGVVFVPDDVVGEVFVSLLAGELAGRTLHPLLTSSISEKLSERWSKVLDSAVDIAVAASDANRPTAALAIVDVDVYLRTPELQEETFGPASLVVRTSPDRVLEVADAMSGSLTATVHLERDEPIARPLLEKLANHAGRVIVNGFPTGVAVVPAMHHGGPYPATTSAAHTSVGTGSTARFLRRVAYQGTPDSWLPEELQDANPRGILREIDGELTTDPVSRQ